MHNEQEVLHNEQEVLHGEQGVLHNEQGVLHNEQEVLHGEQEVLHGEQEVLHGEQEAKILRGGMELDGLFYENRGKTIKRGTLVGEARELMGDERGEKVVSSAKYQ